jgi:hypothetical protein
MAPLTRCLMGVGKKELYIVCVNPSSLHQLQETEGSKLVRLTNTPGMASPGTSTCAGQSSPGEITLGLPF